MPIVLPGALPDVPREQYYNDDKIIHYNDREWEMVDFQKLRYVPWTFHCVPQGINADASGYMLVKLT